MMPTTALSPPYLDGIVADLTVAQKKDSMEVSIDGDIFYFFDIVSLLKNKSQIAYLRFRSAVVKIHREVNFFLNGIGGGADYQVKNQKYTDYDKSQGHDKSGSHG